MDLYIHMSTLTLRPSIWYAQLDVYLFVDISIVIVDLSIVKYILDALLNRSNKAI